MAIFLPGTGDDAALTLDELTPREIVAQLDKYVVGQSAAKRAVAVALRNRTRRQKLAPELADEIMPKNILMIGSTGVGKTEIARRLAKLSGAPFLKVEASKFTEVGYVGRDVESMIRDLVENAIDLVRDEKLDETEDRAELAAEDRLLDLLLAQRALGSQAAVAATATTGSVQADASDAAESAPLANAQPEAKPEAQPEAQHEDTQPLEAGWHTVNTGAATQHTEHTQQPAEPPAVAAMPAAAPASAPTPPTPAEREHLRQQLREGRLDDDTVELETRDRNTPQVEVMSNAPPDEVDTGGLRDLIAGMLQGRARKRPMKVADALDYLIDEEETRMIDPEQVARIAIERVEDAGIVFLDEIDKIAGREGGHGPDISREGVQRDILPIVEGTTVNTKYGNVTTDHILFIAAGAFHVSKPSDLIPELQGRFPIRVELKSLTVDDFLRILTEPQMSLVRQATSLLETEGLVLEFEPEALRAMAELAFRVNETTENIGARRLHTVLEKVLDEVSFYAKEIATGVDLASLGNGTSPSLPPVSERTRDDSATPQRVVTVTAAYVRAQVEAIVKQQDLAKYIL